MNRRLASVALLCGLLAPRPVQATAQLQLHAHRISLYADRLAVVADGTPHMHYPKGADVQADAAFFDLHNDREVWAGHVRATFGHATIEAAALSVEREGAEIFAFVTGDGLPRVERYQGFDPATRTVVALPDDAFNFPSLRDYRPFIYGSHATIVPRVSIRFTPAFFPTGAGVVVPSPSFMFSFVSNPNFGATALNSGNFDQPYGLFGSENSMTAAHFEYNSAFGAGIALTQQFVDGDRAYLALAAGPLRHGAGNASLLAYDRIDSQRSETLSASTSQGLSQFAYRFTQGTRHGAFTFSLGQVSTRMSADAAWASDPYPLARSGFTYRLHADYGFDRDPTGLIPSSADPTFYELMWRTTLGTFVASPTFWGPLGTRMNVTVDASRTWYAYPHRHNIITLGSIISRKVSRQLNLVGQISDTFAGDSYPGRQILFYPPPTGAFVTPAGAVWPGYNAFVGFSSQRTYSLTAYYATVPPLLDLRFNLTAARDFPQFEGYGRPPFSAGFDVRYRPGNTLVVELGRAYAFEWARQGWSPQWIFSISQ